mgnify:CR=1 FL=1
MNESIFDPFYVIGNFSTAAGQQQLREIARNGQGFAGRFLCRRARALYWLRLLQEYRAAYGVKAIVDRCGVLTGPWQMGKVDQGVVVLASCTNDGRAEFDEFVAENTAKYPDIVFVFDPKERSPERASRVLYGVTGIPQQFVIGRDGVLKAEVSGYMAGEVLLDAALAAAGIAVPEATMKQAEADREKRAKVAGARKAMPAAPLQPKGQ